MTISTGYFYQDSNYALYNIYYEHTESGDDDVTRVGEDGETGLNSWSGSIAQRVRVVRDVTWPSRDHAALNPSSVSVLKIDHFVPI